MTHIIHSVSHNHDTLYVSKGPPIYMGGIGSYQTGMVALTTPNLDSGPFTDVTSQVLNDDGSSVAIFEGLTVGNALYIGVDEAIWGLEVDTTTSIVLGSGEIEFQNLTYFPAVIDQWVRPYVMATHFVPVSSSWSEKLQYGNSLFERVQRDNIRIGTNNLISKKTFGGFNKYWYRIRIKTSSITTIPEVNQIKLISSCTKLNENGLVEYFGDARSRREILFHQNMFDASALAGTVSPVDFDVSYSTNVEVSYKEQMFSAGLKAAKVTDLTIPIGIDTSHSITYQLIFKATSANAGDVVITNNNVKIKEDGLIDGSADEENVINTISIGAGEQNLIKTTQFFTNAQSLSRGDRLIINFIRDATANPSPSGDTYDGNVQILGVRAFGYYWLG